MVLDLWMARRIGWQRNLIGNRAKTYRGYFEQALDEKVADSPAAKLAEARARRERLQAGISPVPHGAQLGDLSPQSFEAILRPSDLPGGVAGEQQRKQRSRPDPGRHPRCSPPCP
jgi:hypothetical protein